MMHCRVRWRWGKAFKNFRQNLSVHLVNLWTREQKTQILQPKREKDQIVKLFWCDCNYFGLCLSCFGAAKRPKVCFQAIWKQKKRRGATAQSSSILLFPCFRLCPSDWDAHSVLPVSCFLVHGIRLAFCTSENVVSILYQQLTAIDIQE